MSKQMKATGVQNSTTSLRHVSDIITVRELRKLEFGNKLIIVPPKFGKEYKPVEGEIIAHGPGRRVGPKRKLIPIDVAVGDKVIFSSWAGNRVMLDVGKGVEELLIMHEADLFAKID